jgi:hypothetical protein
MAGASVISDAEGRYSLCLPRAQGTVDVSAEGYGTANAPWRVGLGVPHPTTQDFFLTPAATVVGQVEAQDGQPVTGAVVTAHVGEVIHHGATDALGQFRISDVQGGRVWFEARAEGLRTLSRPSVAVDAGETTESIVIHMAPALAVRGRVVGSGRGVPGVVVLARSAQDSQEAVTQANGEFTIAGLGPGVIRIALADYSARDHLELQLVDRDVGGILVEMQHTGRIRGRVTRAGEPVAGASIDVDSNEDRQSGRTDARGEYEVIGLGPGEYAVKADLPDSAEVAETTVTIGEGEGRDHVDLQLAPDETRPSARISGVVVDERGMGVAGVGVIARRTEPYDGQSGITAGNGTFVIDSLAGGGEYEMEVGYLEFPGSSQLVDTILVRVAPREQREGLRIVLRNASQSISGLVITDEGDPVPDAEVTLESRMVHGCRGGLSWQPGTPVFSELDGKFVFLSVPPGRYRVMARTGAGREGLVVDVEAGARQVIVRLERAGRIEGVIEGFSHLPTIRARRLEAFSDYDLLGRIVSLGAVEPAAMARGARPFLIDGLAPGKYRVTAETAQESREAEVVVTAGGTHSLRIQSLGTSSVVGRAVEEGSGRPVAGASCRAEISGERRVTSVTLSDAAGSFALSPVAAGLARISCTVERQGQLWDGTVEISLEPGGKARAEVVLVPDDNSTMPVRVPRTFIPIEDRETP